MGNALNQELLGKTVRFQPNCTNDPALEGLNFLVSGGFGANASTMGNALYGTFSNGLKTRMEGYLVAEIVPDDLDLIKMVKDRDEAQKRVEDDARAKADTTGRPQKVQMDNIVMTFNPKERKPVDLYDKSAALSLAEEIKLASNKVSEYQQPDLLDGADYILRAADELHRLKAELDEATNSYSALYPDA